MSEEKKLIEKEIEKVHEILVELFKSVIKSLANIMIKIWNGIKKSIRTHILIEMQIQDNKVNKYKKHLKRIENRQKLYEKRKRLGII